MKAFAIVCAAVCHGITLPLRSIAALGGRRQRSPFVDTSLMQGLGSSRMFSGCCSCDFCCGSCLVCKQGRRLLLTLNPTRVQLAHRGGQSLLHPEATTVGVALCAG